MIIDFEHFKRLMNYAINEVNRKDKQQNQITQRNVNCDQNDLHNSKVKKASQKTLIDLICLYLTKAD